MEVQNYFIEYRNYFTKCRNFFLLMPFPMCNEMKSNERRRGSHLTHFFFLCVILRVFTVFRHVCMSFGLRAVQEIGLFVCCFFNFTALYILLIFKYL